MSGTGHTTKVITATGIPVIDGVLGTVAWNDPIIYYTVSTLGSQYTAPYSEADTFNQISAMQETAADWILNTSSGNLADDGFSVEGFTNLGVTKTTNTGSHIRYGESDDPPTAWAYYPSTGQKGGDVWFGNDYDYRSPEAGNYAWATLIHETGHALGLRHGHESDGHGALPAMYDAMEVSIMTYRSYIGGPITGYTNETWGFAQTFMIADIAALQEMYGADYTTNSGDTVYKWDPASGDTLVNGSVGIDAGGNRIFATIWDGGGIDTYDLSAYSTDLTLDLSPGWYSYFNFSQIAYLGNSNYAHGNIYNAMMHDGNTASLIENAIGGSGDDTIFGNQLNNNLSGLAGNDTLDGGLGADTMIGGVGHDTYAVDDVGDVVTEAVGEGSDRVNTTLSTYILADNIEFLAYNGTASGNFTGTGNALDNTIWGWNGNDVLDGGLGADTLIGGDSHDTYYVDNLGDIVVENAGQGVDRVNTSLTTYTLADNVEYLSYTGVSTANFTGTGNDLDNTIWGWTGNDILNGGLGADTMIGGDSHDRYFVDNIGDVIIENFGQGNDRVDVTLTSYTIPANMEQLAYEGPSTTSFNATGNVLNNTIWGWAGDDVFFGGAGGDTIIGSSGTDTSVYTGNEADYTVVDHGSYHSVLHTSTGDEDYLYDIEQLQFDDGLFIL